MSDLVHQIGELFLRAVPVVILVLIFYFLMRSLFFQPLLKVLADHGIIVSAVDDETAMIDVTPESSSQ